MNMILKFCVIVYHCKLSVITQGEFWVDFESK